MFPLNKDHQLSTLFRNNSQPFLLHENMPFSQHQPIPPLLVTRVITRVASQHTSTGDVLLPEDRREQHPEHISGHSVHWQELEECTWLYFKCARSRGNTDINLDKGELVEPYSPKILNVICHKTLEIF